MGTVLFLLLGESSFASDSSFEERTKEINEGKCFQVIITLTHESDYLVWTILPGKST